MTARLYPVLGYSETGYSVVGQVLMGIWSKDYKSFLEKLKKARVDAGLTQVEAAEKLGKPQSYVSKCESGERRVDVIELKQFARLYKRPLTFFN